MLKSNWVTKPGRTIKNILEELKMSNAFFATKLGKDVPYVEKLLKAEIEINEWLANRLSVILGGSKQFWLNRERNYREGLKAGKIDL